MSKFSLENFGLKKVTLKGNNIIVSYDYDHKENPAKEKREYNSVKLNLQPHLDLIESINLLKEILLRDYRIEVTDINLMKTEILGCEITGKDTKALIINGSYTTENEGLVTVKSSRLLFEEMRNDLESDCEPIAESIIEECFKAIFESKRADLTLFEQESDSEYNFEETPKKEPFFNMKTPKQSGLNNLAN